MRASGRELSGVGSEIVVVPAEASGATVAASENAHSRNLAPAARTPAAVYLASLAPGSRRTMAQSLRLAIAVLGLDVELELVPWHELRRPQTQAIRAHLVERYSPATANKVLSAVRGVLLEAERLGLLSAEEGARARDLPNVRGNSPPRGRALDAGELAALRAACDLSQALGVRDVALLAVLFGGGLRRSEAVDLDVEHVGAHDAELVVHGKGAKVRRVYLSRPHARDLSLWLGRRGRGRGPLLCPVHRNGQICVRRLTDKGVRVALRRLATRAGVASFAPHDLRRTFISELLDHGADIATVQRLAGHATVATTARYDRRGERAARAASELLAPRGGDTDTH